MPALALLKKYFPDPFTRAVVMEHSRLVADKALRIADSLPSGEPINRAFLEEAALLHDIGVCRVHLPRLRCESTEPYIRHGIIGREILESEGLPRHALVCERHIGVGLTREDIINQGLPLPLQDMLPISPEEQLISFADLFFSKKPGSVAREKSVDEVRENLRNFGAHKVSVFDEWLVRFNCSPVSL